MLPATLWSLVAMAAALHAGFQLTVTAVVYPFIARLSPTDFARLHPPYTRAVTPLVTLAYGCLGLACATAVALDPANPGTWTTGAAAAATVLVTATRAAPLHGRLAHGHDPGMVRALLRADLLRAALASLTLVSAVVTWVLR